MGRVCGPLAHAPTNARRPQCRRAGRAGERYLGDQPESWAPLPFSRCRRRGRGNSKSSRLPPLLQWRSTVDSRRSGARRCDPSPRAPSMKPTFLLLPLLLMTQSTQAAQTPTPPDVARKPHVVETPFGATRDDAYYWLRDDARKDKAMLAYLEAENAYADAVMAPLKPEQDKLYEEIVARIKQDDSSVPYRERGYWYYSRFETGKDYPIHARRRGSMDGPEEILFDVNRMAAGKDYFSLA